jgi:uncharacterized protein YbjT (DUF2867 family)
MRVILFGATGMVGQGVLRECLLDPDVDGVLSVGRRPTGKEHPKLRELVLTDLTDYRGHEATLTGYDACFFCLGVASAGMKEAEYRKITRDIPAAAGRVLAELNPNLTFILVTGAGTDSTGTSRTMWARVKGEAENAIFALPLKAKYVFRPSLIQPLHGIKSRTLLYRAAYVLFAPFMPLIRALSKQATTTEAIGRAMLAIARRGADQPILDGQAINEVAARG